MYGTPGNHVPPARMYATVDSDTTAGIVSYVRAWNTFTNDVYDGVYRSATDADIPTIHYEAARGIASWYASPGHIGAPFAAFATAGTILDGLTDSIEFEISDAGKLTDPFERDDAQLCLLGLLDYVKTVTGED